MSEFLMPGVDDDPSTEAGVILLGLDAERLLAGLAAAARADDPGLVALSVDHARHGTGSTATFDDLVDEGLHRWRLFVGERAPAPPTVTSGSVRQAWAQALRTVAQAPGEAGPATRAYRAACWLRHEDVHRCAEERR